MAIWFERVYAKIWEVKPSEKYSDIKLGTSEKDTKDKDTKYINSNWLGRAIGHAHQQIVAGDVKAGDRVCIVKGKVTNEPFVDKKTGEKRSTPRVVMFEFETTGYGNANRNSNSAAQKQDDVISDDELPF